MFTIFIKEVIWVGSTPTPQELLVDIIVINLLTSSTYISIGVLPRRYFGSIFTSVLPQNIPMGLKLTQKKQPLKAAFSLSPKPIILSAP
jgi:hypothetical protein